MEHRREARREAGEGARLRAEEDHVLRAERGGIVGRRHRHVARRAVALVQPQPAVPARRESRATREGGDVAGHGEREPRGDEPADGTGPDDAEAGLDFGSVRHSAGPPVRAVMTRGTRRGNPRHSIPSNPRRSPSLGASGPMK